MHTCPELNKLNRNPPPHHHRRRSLQARQRDIARRIEQPVHLASARPAICRSANGAPSSQPRPKPRAKLGDGLGQPPKQIPRAEGPLYP